MNHAELPEGWLEAPLCDVVTPVKVRVDPGEAPDANYIGLEHVEAHSMRLLGHGRGSDVKSTKTKFSAGNVLYGKLRPYLNKVSRPSFDGICSTDFLVFGDSPRLDSGYLAYYLNQLSFAVKAHHLSSGMELPRVDWKSLASVPIRFPVDVSEQRAIVHNIDGIRTLQTEIRSHLSGARSATERFRQTILASACAGRLTEVWRTGHTAGPSGEELARLAEDRRRHARGTLRPIVPNEHTRRVELPERWALAPVGLLLAGMKYGTSKRSDYTSDGTAVMRIPNISKGKIDLSDLKYAVLPDREVNDLALEVSDLLMIRSNGSPQLVGRTVQVSPDAEGMAFAGYLIRLRADQQVVEPSYLALALSTPSVRSQIEMPLRSTSGVNNINTEEVRSLVVPLPPIDEQREVVRQTAWLLDRISLLEKRLRSAELAIERSSQAVLARAFRGELLQVTSR